MHPIISSSLIVAIFLSLSWLVFLKVAFPTYLYALIGITLIISISGAERTHFLKQCFKAKQYYKIRLIENGGLALPFACFLVYKNAPILSLLFLIIALTLAYIPTWIKPNITIPTPFGKLPFEFTRGFRRFFVLVFASYFIAYFAIESNNFNLGLFLLLATFILSSTYYSPTEPFYYLWIYNHNPKLFIIHKFRTILIYSLLPGFPITISLFIFFPTHYWMILIALLVGIQYIILFMLAKYANYPHELSISDSIILTASVLFPPLMLIIIPFFYYRSVKTLSKILYD